MKWILIASVLTWQPVYDSQETCQLAADELKKVYYQEVAACIPKPVDENQEGMDRVFDQFYNMIERLQDLETQRQKELDKFVDDSILNK
jgi:hypothetical protein